MPKKTEPRKPKAEPPGKSKQNNKRLSALDAAARVLAKAAKPMRARELIAAMAKQGLWSSAKGMTPHITLYTAMVREEQDKRLGSRFRKVGRGLFIFSSPASVAPPSCP